MVQLSQIRIGCYRLIQRHSQIVGDHFGNGIAERIGQVQHAAHIPDHTLGRQCTKGNDLHHLVFSVFFHHIVDDLLPPLIAEIHVNIRHGYTLRV